MVDSGHLLLFLEEAFASWLLNSWFFLEENEWVHDSTLPSSVETWAGNKVPQRQGCCLLCPEADLL